MNARNFYVYMLTNKSNTVLYVGVTNNLIRRLTEHRQGLAEGFTKRYKTHKLVHFEVADDVLSAIAREKTIKGWLRCKKDDLVSENNPGWKDLSGDLDF